MNINSKDKRGLAFFFFTIFLLPSLLFANFEVNEKIEEKEIFITPLTLQKQKFVKGSYKVSSIVEKIELLDENKKLLKRVDRPKQLQNTFYFLTQDSNKFFIKITNKKQKIDYKLKIEKVLDVSFEEDKQEILKSKFIKKQEELLKTNKETSAFWKEVEKKGTPLVEELASNKYIITFLYRGAKHNVRLLGGPTSDHELLNQLGNSDIWFKSFEVDKGTRMSYQVAPDVPNIEGSEREKRVAILSSAQKDPLNKTPYLLTKDLKLDKYSQFSTFNIPNDDFYDWTKNLNAPKGKLVDTKIKSKILNNSRTISIYTPFNFDYKKPHQVLFVFDGVDYQIKIPTPRVLDNLIHQKKILPTVAIFVDNASRKSRSSELPPNEKFAKFMAKELFPFVKQKVKFTHKAENTILTGSSYGGLASMFVAFKYPEVFGKVLSQSGSFWWTKDEEPEWLTRQIAKAKKKDLKIYLNAGVYETGYFSIDILESNRHLNTVLKAKGYEKVLYEEFPTSHDYFAWKYFLPEALIKLSKM